MTPKRTVSAALSRARELLEGRSHTPSLDAQLLLGASISRSRAWLLAHPEAEIDEAAEGFFTQGLNKRAAGTPLPYLLGEWEFYGRRFFVNADVLIPRPETEHLVETALEWLQGRAAPARVMDVGTGSGCIAISLALGSPSTQVLGLDISPQALAVARRNSARYGAGNLSLAQSDLLEDLPPGWEKAHLICANLPYIPTETLKEIEVSAHEPLLALDGGGDGLALIARLLDQTGPVLEADGLLLLEIEAGQGESASALARTCFPTAHVDCLPDYSGHPRIIRVDCSTPV